MDIELPAANGPRLRVCLYGPTGSGKSTIAAHLTRKYHGELIKVAEPLHRIQQAFYEIRGVPASGQDGELLQFLAQKIEREDAGWLGRTMIGKVLECASPLVINDDCRWNSYAALNGAGFLFVRVRVEAEERARRLRADHTPVRPDHPVERGFENFRTDHEIDNNGSLDDALKTADALIETLIATSGSPSVKGGVAR